MTLLASGYNVVTFPPPLPPFLWLQAQCQEVRKRKELELQILTETIQLWEGEDIKTLGSVIYMSQAMVQNLGCEVRVFTINQQKIFYTGCTKRTLKKVYT